MPLADRTTAPHTPTATPPAARWRRGLAVVLALLLAGAVYLYIVRGPALLLDLASGMGGMFCL